MKVDFRPTITSQKPTIKSKIKKFFTESRIKLKTLVKDVFEKNTKTNKRDKAFTKLLDYNIYFI